MQSAERPFPYRRGLIIVATLATAYVASHFFRASNVTIGLDLMRDLAIGPEALGALTGAFFFGFAAMQIPCGFFFDRFGPRYTVVGMLIVASLGGALFTLAPSWPVLLTGRALMGAGCGVMLIGSMVVISRWFPPDRFSTLTAMVLSIGLLGNLAATTPLAWASEAVGWRAVFGAVVVFTALATIAIWLVVRDAPPGHPFLSRKVEPPARCSGAARGAAQPAPEADPGAEFLQLCLHLHRAGPVGRRVPARGARLEPDRGRQRPALRRDRLPGRHARLRPARPPARHPQGYRDRRHAGDHSLLAILALFSHPPVWLPVGAIVAMGFFSASSTMVMTHGRGIFPDRLIGRGISTMNTSVMLGVACMQTLSGIIIGAFEPLASGARTEEAYRALFGTLTLVLIVAVAVYSRSQDVKPSEEMRAAGQ